MKKILALLLALVICLSLCACGGKKAASSGDGNASVSVIYPGTGGDKIDLDNLVLVDDSKVKITIAEFYTNKMISAGNSDGGKCATFKIENKTKQDMNISIIPYLDNEALTAASVEGSTMVEAGRVGRIGYAFTYGIYPNWTDLESLDDLYDLEFTFEFAIGFNTGKSEIHKVSCSVADALVSDNMSANSADSAQEEPVFIGPAGAKDSSHWTTAGEANLSVDEITNELVGTWCYDLPDQNSIYPKYVILEFNAEGHYNYFSVIAYTTGHKVDYSSEGTYTVSGDIVKCSIVGESGKVIGYYDYIPVFENGTFKLIQKGHDIECIKGDWYSYLDEHR